MASLSEETKKRPPVAHAVAGFLAGAIATTLLFPLDLIKVRFQAESSRHLPTIADKMLSIRKTEGFRSLFAGLSPALAASAVSWAGFFFMYERAKTRRTDENLHLTRSEKMARDALSSIEAGAVMVLITNPIWLVKTRLQLQPTYYKGLVDALTRIPREEGIFALYRGLFPALLLTSHGAIQLVVYEELKRFRDPNGSTAGLALVYGSIAKLAASIATYPYQVVKTRVQQRFPHSAANNKKNLAASELARTYYCVKDTLRHEGLRGFFKGCWPSCLKVIPSAAITFWTYELILRRVPL